MPSLLEPKKREPMNPPTPAKSTPANAMLSLEMVFLGATAGERRVAARTTGGAAAGRGCTVRVSPVVMVTEMA